MQNKRPKTDPTRNMPDEHVKCNCLTVERTFGSLDLIELVADYIADKIEIEHPGEHQKCKRTDC